MSEETTVVTGVVRGSYVRVFEPALNDLSGNMEYSMAVLVPKSDKATIAKLKKAANAALAKKWPDASSRPRNLRNPLRDGDEKDPPDEAYEDHYFFNCKSSTAPGIVDGKLKPVTDAREFVSGDYCRVSLNAYAYDKKGNRGVAFGLNNIQVVEKGDPLGGANTPPEYDFDALEEGGAAEDFGDEDMFS